MTTINSMIFQFKFIKNVVTFGNCTTNLLSRINNRLNKSLYSTSTDTSQNVEKQSSTSSINAPKKMNRAMLAYLERAKSHDAFINKEKEDYLIGKRHLANIMGEDPEMFTQADVDRAIEYLFPSGLFDKAARPIMKPPEEIFPPKRAAQFDETGRPFHSMFYTVTPQYFKTLYDFVEEMEKLKKIEDDMIRQGTTPDPNIQFDPNSSKWLTYDELKKVLLENIGERDYEYFIATGNRLLEHPLAYLSKDVLMKYRKEKILLVKSLTTIPLEYDSEGRPYVIVPDCMRKSSRGSVIVKGKGSGKIKVNGTPLYQYFPRTQDREQVIFPLHFTGMMDKVDIEAEVRMGGPTGQSGCIRWGISWALRSFVENDMVEKMRLAGLLTRDWRRRERKKPGQEGARRKFTWKKR